VGKLTTTTAIFRGVIWFVGIDLLILGLMIAVPGLVLFLPQMMG
jgi:TRAP-type mannitol/chloroaromatic compound transport system permease large subunit